MSGWALFARARLTLIIFFAIFFTGCATSQVKPIRDQAGIVRLYFSDWANGAHVGGVDNLVATNVVLRHPHVTVNGLAAYKQSMAAFRVGFPDLHFSVEDQFGEGDKQVVRWIMTGTQLGEFQGRSASGKRINVMGTSLFRLADGKIQEIWVNMDRLGFQEQLGWLPVATPTRSAAGSYHELRIYTVTSNKMDGVMERFRETVEPVRKKHGIETVAYWMAPGSTNGGFFVYLMAASTKDDLLRREKEFGADPDFKKGYAASNEKHGKTVDKIVALPLERDPTASFDFAASPVPRAFDLRVYSVLPGKLEAFRDRWRDHAAPIYARHGMRCLGWWVAAEKDAEGHDQFVCLLAAESLEAIPKSIAAFHADPAWQQIEKETEANGKLRSSVVSYKLTPLDFSPLK